MIEVVAAVAVPGLIAAALVLVLVLVLRRGEYTRRRYLERARNRSLRGRRGAECLL